MGGGGLAAGFESRASECAKLMLELDNRVCNLKSDVEKLSAAHLADFTGMQVSQLPDFRAKLLAQMTAQTSATFGSVCAYRDYLAAEIDATRKVYETMACRDDSGWCHFGPFPNPDILLSALDAVVLNLNSIHKSLDEKMRVLGDILCLMSGNTALQNCDTVTNIILESQIILKRGNCDVLWSVERLRNM